MKKYKLVITNRFEKDFKRLDFQIRGRVMNALEKIEQNPYLGEKTAIFETGIYRFRVGEYRIRYDVIGNEIILLKVRHRKESYR